MDSDDTFEMNLEDAHSWEDGQPEKRCPEFGIGHYTFTYLSSRKPQVVRSIRLAGFPPALLHTDAFDHIAANQYLQRGKHGCQTGG